ncbi:hypothetical protein EB118_05330 [bacterium]|nr:hypothetical protein [bacterium]NDC93758.1 hypothetical protein [bacterium]NDD83091.1 hypothetical protein [bacterium]NDG29506.1 hypothetical protein [bacterium]
MNVDTVIELLSNLDPDTLWNVCKVNKEYNEICRNHKNVILRKVLKSCYVDYEDQRSVVYLDRVRHKDKYKYVYVDINKYKREDGSYKLGSIFKRYLVWYNMDRSVDIGGLGVSNVPSMPKLHELYCNDNNIKQIVGDFGNLKRLDCSHNQIEVLGKMPSLEVLDINHNPITEIGGFRNLYLLTAHEMSNLQKIYGMTLDQLFISYTRNSNVKLKLVDLVVRDTLQLETLNRGDTTNDIPEMSSAVITTFVITKL